MKRNMKNTLLSIALFSLALAPGCFNKDKSSSTSNNSTASDSKSFDDYVQELMTVTGTKEALGKMFDMSIAQMQASMDSKTNKDSEELIKNMRSIVTSQDFVDKVAAIYKKYFSKQDIHNLIQFHSSPSGKKSLEVMPKLAQETMQLSMQQMQGVIAKHAAKQKPAVPANDTPKANTKPTPPVADKSLAGTQHA